MICDSLQAEEQDPDTDWTLEAEVSPRRQTIQQGPENNETKLQKTLGALGAQCDMRIETSK